ncbi:DUF4129 domain-containing protein [Nocardioides sp. HM23]|uniref:DUF4129 domain-containing protein n=1 Tax=Nocardioides bizhenqiangii TaxID=3095076 RepID=UPI002ACAFB67|nr:DUF4129 domain-containing protein [Nocardioides sp. HM23]MDZ5622980.1 DUF4129 domain-containing protein [Nocardioides sp. HM23]
MGTNSRSPLTLGALLLVLCALVAATFDGPRWDDLERGAERPAVSEGDRAADEPDDAAAEEESQPPPDDDEPWLPWAPPLDLLLVLSAALVFGVALIVLARLRLVRRRKQLSGRIGVRASLVPAEPPPDEEVGAELPEALDEGARTIGQGSPRNAIVAAWVRLERAVESDRFPHRPEETPSELVERALAAYRLDHDAIRRLAALYREARFSAHPITEEHRVEAADCLRRLLATLGARSR